MVTRIGMFAALAATLLAGTAEAAPRGGGGSAGSSGGGRGGVSGGRGGVSGGPSSGSVSRGTSTGGRKIIAGPYGSGAGSSNNFNNFGGGAFFGMNNGRFGHGRNGIGGFGLVGLGGLGVPLGYGYGYGMGYPVPVDDAPMFPPPPPPPIGPSLFGAPGPGGPGTIAFSVPENSLVWVNNDLLAQTGPERTYTTPPLVGGSLASYSVRVKWTENGQEKSFTQRVTVRAAGRSSVTIFSRGDDKK